MKKIIFAAAFLASALFGVELPKTHVVEPDWLAKHAKEVVIVDTQSPLFYKRGHIPGAVNIPKKYFFTGKDGDIGHLIGTPEQIKEIFDKAGVNNDSVVVFTAHVKKDKKYTDMTRAAWVAYVYGLKNVAILDGGIENWVATGHKLESGAVTPKKGNFTPKVFKRDAIASLVDVEAALVNKDVQFVDAREKKHYVGADKDKRLKKHGHIPGAMKVSAYMFAKKDGKVFKLVSPEKAKELFTKAGVDVNKPIYVYCNTGHLASGTWFVGKFLVGIKNIANYDGSMFEYTRTDLPVEK